MPIPHLAKKSKPRVTVLGSREIPGMSEDSRLHACELGEALTREWDCDAHVVAYAPMTVPVEGTDRKALLRPITRPTGDRPAIYDVLDDLGLDGVEMVALIGDLDGPGHVATDEWRAEVEPRLEASGLAWYRTRGGARVIQPLADAIMIRDREGAGVWSQLYLGWVEWLRQSHGLELDELHDWTRLFRLPNVVRDGEAQRAPVNGQMVPFRLDAHWCPPPKVPDTPHEAPANRDSQEPTTHADTARQAAFAAMSAALGSWEDHDGQKHAICGAVGGLMRKLDFRAADCAAFLRGWLPEGEPGVDVEAGVRWACGAWEQDAEQVSGIGVLADLVGPARASVFDRAAQSFRSWRRADDGPALSPVTAPRAVGATAFGVPQSWTDAEQPLEYLCQGLRLAPSTGKISVIAGQPGGGKGPLANHLAACFALGEPAFGTHEVTRSNVLLLDCEGYRLTMRRLRRLTRGMGRDPAELQGALHLFDASASDLLDPETMGELASYLEEHQIGVVVLDSYTSAMLRAGVDANSPQFALLAQALGQLGVLVLAVAHSNKAVAGRAPSLQDIAYSGAFGAMAQTAIVVHYPDPDERNTIAVGCARAPETGFAQFEVVFADGAKDSLTVRSRSAMALREGRVERATSKELAAVTRRAEKIRDAVKRVDTLNAGTTVSKVKSAAGINGERWGDALAEACRRRWVEVESLPHQRHVTIRLARGAPDEGEESSTLESRLPKPGEVASVHQRRPRNEVRDRKRGTGHR